MKTSINADIEISVTPEQLAEWFWNMDSHDQAMFFNRIAGFTGFQWQMNQVALSPNLQGGQKAMRQIGLAVQDGLWK